MRHRAVRRLPRSWVGPTAAAGVALLAACSGGASGRDDSAAAADSVHRAAVIDGFRAPESVRYDAEQDVYFVSNMNGGPSAPDDNGYISRMSAADPSHAVVFVQSGRDGVRLDAPKGMAIHGDTLWVADLTAVRAFDRHTGARLLDVDFSAQHPLFLNDVAIGPGGDIYISDTGITIDTLGTVHHGPDRIFRIGAGHAISVFAEGDRLGQPNGMTWDSAGGRWIIVSFEPLHSRVYTLAAGDTLPKLIASGPGRFDGVELIGGGRMLVSSWADSAIHEYSGAKGRRLITDLPIPADIGIDTRRNRVAVPLTMLGRVEIWELPAAR